MYVESPNLENPRFHKLFRRRFRMPYKCFQELVQMVEDSPLFARWREGKNDAAHRPATPLSLLVLCVLRYIGRGWTLDDLSENTGISEEVIRVFVHKFIEFGSTVLYKKFVVAPKTAEDAAEHTPEYEKAGLPGCVGSMDATHILLEKVEYRLRQSHLGFKSSHTARSYNITVNNRRKILATTTGHPARWNDKTVVLFDNFAVALHEGTTLQDVTFELYDVNSCGSVFKQKYVGAWLIVDNGYLNWPTTVPPMKTSLSRASIRFSQWLESIRKDVECTFGILKGRFRILKTGIRLVGQESADKIFLTCCALHNWLLHEDGLDSAWEDGVQSDWEGQLGLHNVQDVEYHIPDAVQRLMSRREMQHFDVSGMGFGSDVRHEQSHQRRRHNAGVETQRSLRDDADEAESVRVVKDLSLEFFRSKLIRHFDIAFQRNEIQWPGKRNRIQQVHI
jgi:hypothetical protein